MEDIQVVDNPTDEETVELEPDSEEAETPFVYDENALNLAVEFALHPEGEDALKEITRLVKSNYDDAFAASEKYRERFKNDWAIFNGELPDKTWPWQDSANAHLPLMQENITRLSARASGELFGDWQNVFGVVPMGPDDDATAELLNKHGNWQIREQIPDFRRQVGDRGVLAFFWIGDVTVHSYYDTDLKQNRHEVLTPDEFVVPFTFTSTMPDYSDCPWRCKVKHYYRHELEAMREQWVNVDKLLEGALPSWDTTPEQEITETVTRVQGTEIVEHDGSKIAPNAPYKLLEYEGWVRLPNQDGDRFVQVIMHHESSTLLKLSIHEEEDWQDADRFRKQQAELQQFRSAQAEHAAQIDQLAQQQHIMMASHSADLAGPELTKQGLDQVQQQLQNTPPPTPPYWMKDPNNMLEGPEPARRVPLHMYTHIVCLEPFVGAYGGSYGRTQADFNRGANTMLSQFLDSATLANVQSFLVTDAVDFGDSRPVGPGSVRKVKGIIGDDLQKNIMPLKFGPANDQLMQGVDRFYNWAREGMQAPEVLSGEPGKSGETFRGISARIEQATKQLSVVTRKYADGLEQILKNNAKLNAKWMPDEELVNIASHAGNPAQQIKVSRGLYDRDYRVQIRADLRFATQAQRIQEADDLMAFAGKVPQLMQNPDFMKAAVKKGLRARGMDDMVQLVDQAFQPPPQPPAPPGGAPGGAPGMPPGGAPPMPQQGGM